VHSKSWLGSLKENFGDKVLGERIILKIDAGEIECEGVY
jgi:hypothetical protein